MVQGPICMLIVVHRYSGGTGGSDGSAGTSPTPSGYEGKGQGITTNLEPVRYMLVEEEQEAQQHITGLMPETYPITSPGAGGAGGGGAGEGRRC